ncbi:MAG: ABC transporter substrate-binding protein, partial [Candidatus Bathyarchaeia archaeon]
IFLDPTLKTPALIQGEVDAITEFAMQKPVVEKAAEEKGGANMLLWADYGVTLYSNGILFSEEWINERPNVVRCFLRVIVIGFLYTFENPDEAVEILLKRYPTLDKDVARAEIDIVKRLVLVPEAEENGIGYFDSAKVQSTIDAVTVAYSLTVKVSPEDIYTSEFLPGKISL